MKPNFPNFSLFSALMLIGGGVFSGCQDYAPEINYQAVESKEFAKSGVFDFAMSHDVSIQIDFNRPSANNPVWIYDQYPYDEEGDMKSGVEPIYAFFLKDGAYKGAFHPATALDRVWVVCGGMGLPMLTQAEIENGEISISGGATRAVIPVSGTITENSAGTLATDKYHIVKATESNLIENVTPTTPVYNTPELNTRRNQVYDKLYTLYDWTISGKPLASSTSTSTPESAPTVSGVWNYNNQSDAAFAMTGDWSQYEAPGAPTPVAASYKFSATREWEHYFYFIKDNQDKSGFNKIEINDASAGKLRIYHYNNEARNFTYDNTQIAEPNHACGGNVFYFEHVFTDASPETKHVVLPTANSGNILYLEYFKAGEDTPVTCYVKKEGSDYSFVQSTPDFFTMTVGTSKAGGTHTPFTPLSSSFDNVISNYLTLPDSETKGIQLNIDKTDKGTVKVYCYDIDNFENAPYWDSEKNKLADKKIKIDGTGVSFNKSTEKETNIRYITKDCTDDNKVNDILGNGNGKSAPFNIVYIEYTSEAGSKYYCYFDENGQLIQNRAGFFSLSNTLATFGPTQKKQAGPDEVQTVTVNSVTYDHCLELTADNKLTVTVPAYTRTDLNLVFATNEKASIKLNGETKSSDNNQLTCVIDNSTSAPVNYVVARNISNLHLYYASITNHLDDGGVADWYQATNYTNNVYKYRNIDDPALTGLYDEEFHKMVNRLSNTLWRKTGSKTNAKATYGDTFNQEYASSESSKSDLVVAENNTQLFVTFIGEYDTFSANTFGYYVYPTDNRPTSIDQIDKMFIIFPNCTSTDYTSSRLYKRSEKVDGNTVYNYSREELVPLKCGDQVQIMFPKSDGTYQKEFPTGYSIGWFVIYNGFDAWDLKNNTTTTGHVRLGALNNDGYGRTMMDTRIYFADPNLNQEDPSDVGDPATRSRCVQLTDKKSDGTLTDYFALCFEDSYSKSDGHSGTQDRTYDDLIFTVKGKLTNPSNQYTDGDENSYISYREEGIYAFEDIWDGSQTDFDMNDVAVQYSRTYSIHHCPNDNTMDNHIAKVDEVYTVLNDGATYEDAFAVELPYANTDISTIMYKEEGNDPVALNTTVNATKPYLEYDGDKVSIIMFKDINSITMGQKYSFEINFSTPLATTTVGSASNGTVGSMTSNYNRASYNPYIIVANYTDTPEKRCEIHLPGKGTTTKGIVPVNQYNSNNRWYVVRLEESLYDGLSGEGLKILPFAIDIPTTSFKGCREGVFVTTDYPKFFDWAKSKGASNANWYSTPSSEAKWERKQ